MKWINVTVRFSSTSHRIRLQNGTFIWENTPNAIDTGGTIPAILFGGAAASLGLSYAIVRGVDLSAQNGSLVFGSVTPYKVTFINCKTNAAVTVSDTPTETAGSWVDFLIGDSGTKNYRQERYRYEGTLTAEPVIVPTLQQASDGTTPITWKVVTTANPEWQTPFETFPYNEWMETTGASVTRTFEIVNDGTTLTNAEVWADVEYLGDASFPIASFATSGLADILATPVNLTTSTVGWTTTGLASPVKQTVAVTFTPQMKGFFRIVFKVARPSKTVYINPRPNEV